MAVSSRNRRLGISGAVRLIVEGNLPAKIALSLGYANISALARLIKPRVEALLGREAGVEAIIAALKRIRPPLESPREEVSSVIMGSSVTIKTGIHKLSLTRSKRSTKVILDVLRRRHEHLIHLTEGTSSITIAVDERAAEEILGMVSRENLLEYEEDLAALIISSPPEISAVPGCLIPIYMKLYERGINIEDTSSSYTDTVILVSSKDATEAFTALVELMESLKAVHRRGSISPIDVGGPA